MAILFIIFKNLIPEVIIALMMGLMEIKMSLTSICSLFFIGTFLLRAIWNSSIFGSHEFLAGNKSYCLLSCLDEENYQSAVIWCLSSI